MRQCSLSFKPFKHHEEYQSLMNVDLFSYRLRVNKLVNQNLSVLVAYFVNSRNLEIPIKYSVVKVQSTKLRFN